jgi:signal transduction histidine kinase
LANYQENLRNLASQLSLAEERERRRLALFLHDQIGHTLALTNIRLGEIMEASAKDSAMVLQSHLQVVRSLIEQAIYMRMSSDTWEDVVKSVVNPGKTSG